MNINRVIADIEISKRCCRSENNPTNDEYFYDAAAYHIQQAIEKELKYILHNIYGMDDKTRSFRTHNISTLLLYLGRYNSDFVQNKCQSLIEMSDTLTSWEASCRYGEDIASTRRDIEKAITIAEDMLTKIQDLEKTVTKEESLNIDEEDYER